MALFEAAASSARATAPDHTYYETVRDRLTPNRPMLSVARKLVRRARHILIGLGAALGLARGDEPVTVAATAAAAGAAGVERPLAGDLDSDRVAALRAGVHAAAVPGSVADVRAGGTSVQP